MADPLRDIADRLYAGPVGTFTDDRDEAAKRADREVAARVRKLRKPSTAAWAVNQLVRREPEQIERALELGRALRGAAESMQGEELRTLTRQRRQLTTALAGTARSLAREHGVRLSTAIVEQVEAVLNAAMLDPVAADVVRTGLLVRPFGSTGMSELDVETVLAVPAAVGTRATAVAAPEPPARSGLHVVPEDERVRRARAEDALEQAEAAYQRQREALDDLERAARDLEARRLQLAGELDELRRRVAGLEEDIDAVDEDLEESRALRAEAGEALASAEAERDAARRRLDSV
ncbi:MAG: hypothetical protein ACRDPH_03455 [Marmoricola sp.]